MKTALYRHFDAAGQLLYVGISLSAVQRLEQHRAKAGWFEEIADVNIEWLPSRKAALTAEALAITRENPIWNLWRPKTDAVACAIRRRAHWWAAVHPRSGFMNGWYKDKEFAELIADHCREHYPLEEFEVLEYASNPVPCDDAELLTVGSHKHWGPNAKTSFECDDYRYLTPVGPRVPDLIGAEA